MKPYKLKLKKVSSHEQALLSAIYEYLPATGVKEQVVDGIKQAINRHVGQQCNIYLEAMHQESYSEYASKIPQSTVLAVFGMTPLNKKAVCEIDPLLAIALIERLLGGNPSMNLQIRDLSDTEQGVLQYLILQILSSIYRSCGNSARVHFRFDRFASNEMGLRDLIEKDDGVAILVFRVEVGRHSGFVRLAFPDPFIEESFLNVESLSESRVDERKYELDLISRYNFIRVPIWAEVGSLTLMPAELSSIEEGDIVLLDESYVRLADGKVKGHAIIRFGDGENGGLDSELSIEKNVAHCRIDGFHK
ncbi:MAG: hypothetical protein HN337_08515 [Deltaproteobacteria bacterium]|jgi:flagellar motor switch protein FliM|nr:hypothetical protein [Deltaproteobacteria bacterium]